MAAKLKKNNDFLLQKNVILCPLMFRTKFELNRSIIEKNRLKPCLKTRLQTYKGELILDNVPLYVCRRVCRHDCSQF